MKTEQPASLESKQSEKQIISKIEEVNPLEQPKINE